MIHLLWLIIDQQEKYQISDKSLTWNDLGRWKFATVTLNEILKMNF